MPFDDDLVLIDGTATLGPTTDTAATSTTVDANGALVLDIKKTGLKDLCAVMICPTAPTTYADTLTGYIEHSHHVSTGFERIASFPVLYALVREVYCTPTTAFVEADISQTLTATTDSASDGGTILDFDHSLLTVGNTGRILVQMSDANDDYSTAGDTLTSGGTGVGTQGAASVLTKERSYGIYVAKFQTNRRYIRANLTVSAGGSWGAVKVLITNDYPVHTSL